MNLHSLKRHTVDHLPGTDRPARVVKVGSRSRQEEESFLQLLVKWLRKVVHHGEGATLRNAIEDAMDIHEEENEAAIPSEEKSILQNLLQFGELRVRDIMVPRTEIIAVPETITSDELKKLLIENRHTRLPVFRTSLDDIRGFLHIKDLLPILWNDSQRFRAADLMRQILVAPPSMRVIDLLVKMRLSGVHMAIVVDEYGGTDGLVTLENLFEEIVGDIQDEHDEVEDTTVLRLDDFTVEADARVRLERLAVEMPELEPLLAHRTEDIDTLGSLVISLANRIPALKEVLPLENGIRFEVVAAEARAVKRVRIHLPRPEA